MASEDDILISDLASSHPLTLDGANTLIPIAHPDVGSETGYATMSTTPNQLGAYAVEGQTFVNLKTGNKTVESSINQTVSNFADDFSTSSTYDVDDCVLYEGVLYKCITAITTAGAWDSTKWTTVKAVDVGSGGGGGSSTLAGLTDTNITSPSDGQVLKYDGTNSKWVNSAGGSGGSGHTILDDGGTSLTQRSNLQFKGAYSEDNSTDSVTEVNIVRSMTKAEFDLLSADEKVGIINITDDISGGLKYVKTVLWENIDEDNMTILTDGDTIILSDNILDYDEVYFEACFLDPTLPAGNHMGHLVSSKVLKETLQLAKSKYGSQTFQGIFDVCLNYVYYSTYYSFNYSLKIPTDNSLYVAKKFIAEWTANNCTITRIIGIKYLSDSEHTYSTSEQIVGTWIDGSTIYEKTLELNSVSIGTGWAVIGNMPNIAKLVSCDTQSLKTSTNEYCYTGLPAVYYYSNGNIALYNFLGGSMGTVSGYVTVRYTKSST